MKDYRVPENRREYFMRLYDMNLTHGVMPGLVYLYMPALAGHFGWGSGQRLWFAFLNGMTQNPITSLRLFEQLPEVPPAGAQLTRFTDWFNAEWDTLQFDTDRRYQKKDTVAAIKAYARAVAEFGSQEVMLARGKLYVDLWKTVREKYVSFGRLSSFSYLEYVYLNGYGSDCDNLLFEDKSGSKSHRNGMLLLLCQDHLVWDKRLQNGQTGDYPHFKKMCEWLTDHAEKVLEEFKRDYSKVDAGLFTLESNLCTFKNHFFGRRYPGVYADMAWERIEWAEARGVNCSLFKEIRSGYLPEWLRAECEKERLPLKEKAAIFPRTGRPYRADNFITE